MRSFYHETYLDANNKEAMALCPDNKIRKITLTNGGNADTFFSIPARVQVKGKTVTGYVTIETKEGYSTATENDPAMVKFVAYVYGKNGAIFTSDTLA